jgi:hypothetical protein
VGSLQLAAGKEQKQKKSSRKAAEVAEKNKKDFRHKFTYQIDRSDGP